VRALWRKPRVVLRREDHLPSPRTRMAYAACMDHVKRVQEKRL